MTTDGAFPRAQRDTSPLPVPVDDARDEPMLFRDSTPDEWRHLHVDAVLMARTLFGQDSPADELAAAALTALDRSSRPYRPVNRRGRLLEAVMQAGQPYRALREARPDGPTLGARLGASAADATGDSGRRPIVLEPPMVVAAADEPTADEPPGPDPGGGVAVWSRRRRVLLAGALAAVIALVALVVLLSSRSSPNTPTTPPQVVGSSGADSRPGGADASGAGGPAGSGNGSTNSGTNAPGTGGGSRPFVPVPQISGGAGGASLPVGSGAPATAGPPGSPGSSGSSGAPAPSGTSTAPVSSAPTSPSVPPTSAGPTGLPTSALPSCVLSGAVLPSCLPL